jgi:hypothetical protein
MHYTSILGYMTSINKYIDFVVLYFIEWLDGRYLIAREPHLYRVLERGRRAASAKAEAVAGIPKSNRSWLRIIDESP